MQQFRFLTGVGLGPLWGGSGFGGFSVVGWRGFGFGDFRAAGSMVNHFEGFRACRSLGRLKR